MSNTEFFKEKNKDYYLYSTDVENLVINELFPAAPGDYVKVYLIGLMRAQYGIIESRDKTANILGMSIEQIDNAWEYWKKLGAIEKEFLPGEDDYRIIFQSQISRFYGSKKELKKDESIKNDKRLVNLDLKNLYDEYESASGRMISTSEARKIADTIANFGVSSEVFSYAIKYCSENNHTEIKYIIKVAVNWHNNGCQTALDVKKLLDKDAKRRYLYERIFKAIGFSRQWTNGDKDLMDRWFDEFEFSLEEVLEAIKLTAGQREPSLRYVNRVLENKYRETGGIKTNYERSQNRYRGSDENKKTDRQNQGSQGTNVSKKVLGEYLLELRNKSIEEQQAHKLEIDEKFPVMKKFAAMEASIKESLMNFDFSIKGKENRTKLMSQKVELANSKKEFLMANGYPEDYLDVKHKCSICKDHGITDEGKPCVCVKERAEEAYRWNKTRQAKQK